MLQQIMLDTYMLSSFIGLLQLLLFLQEQLFGLQFRTLTIKIHIANLN